MGKWLMLAGAALVVIGVAVQLLGHWIPFGQLPGDFKWTRGHTTFYFPLATSLAVSVVLTVLAQLWFRR